MKNKICLGTVQFGLDYGLTNHRGIVTSEKMDEILNYAHDHGVKILDTADNYGNSEKRIGKYQGKTKKYFRIISKFSSQRACDFDNVVKNSLENLKTDKLYGLLIHDFSSYIKDPEIGKLLRSYKEKHIIDNIGFSLYYPKEAEYIIEHNFSCDIIQIPFNIFDQRFAVLLPELKKRNIKIFARSVFLQGLLLMNPEKLPSFFDEIKKPLAALRKISQDEKIPLPAMCVGFVLTEPLIDKIVIGVSSLDDLKENLKSGTYLENVRKIRTNLTKFFVKNEKLIVPLNWPKKKT